MDITVIIPGYNEEANVQGTLDLALEHMRSLGRSFELLVVDDASRDRTLAIARDFESVHSEVRVLANPVNIGQGASIIRGFREARGNWVIHNAMDYPFDLRDIRKLLDHAPNADVVVAARNNWTGYTLYRRILSRVNRLLLRTLFSLPITDYNFTQLIRRDVLQRVPLESSSTGFLTPSILIAAHDLGFRVEEVEVTYHPRLHGEPTAGSPRVVLRSFENMLRFWLKRNRVTKLMQAKPGPFPPSSR